MTFNECCNHKQDIAILSAQEFMISFHCKSTSLVKVYFSRNEVVQEHGVFEPGNSMGPCEARCDDLLSNEDLVDF